MRFALFYEIPVARPWDADSERRAYEHTLEQAVAGERFGWDAFWTVEHHFLVRVLPLLEPRGALRRDRRQNGAHAARIRCALDAASPTTTRSARQRRSRYST